MSGSSVRRYFVAVEKISDSPIVEASGALASNVTLGIRADGEQENFLVDVGNVSGEILSNCQAIQEKGHVIVDMPLDWNPNRADDRWLHEIAVAAQDRAKSESA